MPLPTGILCFRRITKSNVRNALKKMRLEKLLGLDDIP